ncbi:hypothetical protein BCR33DRAFT_853686 [Rhizoclosmatium globosum]|uniref:Xylanolytic transcriptional activator regulatory domain-containing protein n=1 Tax=Rhizoclosmatium globosum TaxID=329046 RepID=A0A1Y2BWJ6_9FUNG|nr:hypothetical protein BCR33DRAFT_853686 [Rhizoclosmatium globosum]|eukprot:ORY39140.1 hypothetical protein BCR33DRAFT_853686 [Rhizoclosmatium globosum]
MAQTVAALESGPAGGGYFTPILTCMKAMLREIDHVHEFGRGWSSDNMNDIELGMRTVSLGGVDDIQASQTNEPDSTALSGSAEHTTLVRIVPPATQSQAVIPDRNLLQRNANSSSSAAILSRTSLSTSPVDLTISATPRLAPLHCYLQALETPFMLTEDTDLMDTRTSSTVSSEMEDLDLMPTMEDLHLCYRFATKNGQRSLLLATQFDAEAFQRNFFHLSPVYRLTRCAMAAYYYSSDEEANVYYQRARKAFAKYGGIPSVETVRACSLLNTFALNRGQPVIGLQFLKVAVSMIHELQLHIDPDDSPWLNQLTLTPREKEDRRRAFWEVYYHYIWHQALCNDFDTIHVEITCNQMKSPSQVFDPHPVFFPLPVRKAECQILSLIVNIKHLFSIPPHLAIELLVSVRVEGLRNALNEIHSDSRRVAVPCTIFRTWWNFTSVRIMDTERLYPTLLDMAQFMRGMEAREGDSGYTSPFVKAVIEMLGEIERVRIYGWKKWKESDMQNMELAMQVMSIGNSLDDSYDIVEPYTFLGLLGFELGGIRWKGRKEESWRLFWKMCA